jgi:DNA (cytosine-5)-methyltransferase 1
VIYGSLCSGIEAATQAWHPLGWKPAFFSEIERFPSAVLAHHYPDIPNLGDMTKFKDWPDHAIDLLVGGTPCQSFSVAGLRGGLADPRGNLMLTFGAVAKRYQPRWLVWENVPGVLSSNGGRDFGTFLGMLAELGYGFAYRVLDAQYVRTRGHAWAVPQRRRRVFVVGYLGDWRRAAAVLFDGESLSGNSPPRREAGKGIARGFEVGPSGGGFTDLAPTLDARCKDGPIRNQLGSGAFVPVANSGDVGYCLTSSGQQSLDAETETLLAVAIQERAICENPDAGPDGIGVRQDGAAYTLEARTVPQAVAFSFKDYGNDAASEVSPTLRSLGAYDSNGGSQMAVATQWAVRRLMPVECERLQGFPDGFTDIPWRGGRAVDGPRYKALGNSMAVNVMTWLGERIQMVEDML